MDAMQIILEARKRLLKTFPYFAFRAYQLELIPSTKTAKAPSENLPLLCLPRISTGADPQHQDCDDGN